MRSTALTDFFARLSVATYRDALTKDQMRQLAAATIFREGVPIPRAALEAAGAAVGVETAAVGRLLALGLLDDWGTIGGVPHAATNPLARPLAPQLQAADRQRMACAALPQLLVAWRRTNGAFPVDPRGLVVTEIALEISTDPEVLEAAAFAASAWLARVQGETRSALDLIKRTFAALPPDYAASPDFLRLALECAALLSEITLIERLLIVQVRQSDSACQIDAVARARLDLRRGEWQLRIGDAQDAEMLTRSALETFRAASDERMVAVAAGQVADILQARGEPEKALRMRFDEVLPVLERRGDMRERAVTLGKIADLLHARGRFDEALEIRLQEEEPIYRRTDERELSVVLQKIASALTAAGGPNDGERAKQARQAAAEAYAIATRLSLPDGIAHAGALFAEILGREGETLEALNVLDKAEAAFIKICDLQGQLHASFLRREISRRAQRSS